MSNDARSQARNGQELYFYQRGRPRAIATRLRVPHSMRSGSILRIFYLSFRNIDKHLSGRESQVSKQTAKLLLFFLRDLRGKRGESTFLFCPKTSRTPCSLSYFAQTPPARMYQLPLPLYHHPLSSQRRELLS